MVMNTGDIGYSNNKGKVYASRDILYSVISLAVNEVKGVASIMTARKTVAKKPGDGVKVNFLNNGVEIVVYVKVHYNVSVPEIASRIQESIKNGIASMLDVKVKKIDVNVVGVEFLGVNGGAQLAGAKGN